MKKIPVSLLSYIGLFLHILALPVFFLAFILIYESEWMDRFLNANGEMMIFNALMLTCILIGIMCGSRIPLTVYRERLRLSWWQYSLWSLAELLVYSCFAALYMALIYGHIGYFPALGHCLQLNFAILPYAYVINALLITLVRPDAPAPAEEDLIRFADSTGRLKLVIAHDVLLFIEAQENYIHIYYLDGEKVKEYALRQSMRGIDELMDRHHIIRCQRSFFVNPRHVKVLRRDKEGMIQAELDVASMRPVPVSPKYYEQLSKML